MDGSHVVGFFNRDMHLSCSKKKRKVFYFDGILLGV